MKKPRGGTRWLKYGCFGCLGLLGLLVVFFGAVTGLAWFKASSAEVKVHAADHAVAPEPGTVILEIEAQVQLEIEPGPEGSPIGLAASYDRRSFELQDELLEGDGSGWTYRLAFRRTGSSWVTSLSGLFGGSQPTLRLRLPVDVPMSLSLAMSEGGAEARFGGLWLTSAELDMKQGGMHLEFDEPMREPMESLSIRASMGGFALEGLGNASPRKLDLDCSMGGGFIDLRGAWVTDSEINIKASMGGAALQLPRDVHVVGVETSRLRRAEDSEVPLPTLTFTITTGMGGDVDVIE